MGTEGNTDSRMANKKRSLPGLKSDRAELLLGTGLRVPSNHHVLEADETLPEVSSQELSHARRASNKCTAAGADINVEPLSDGSASMRIKRNVK